MEQEPKKNTHGGARPGAGRKPGGVPKKTITVRISFKAEENLEAYTASHGISRQAAINEIFETLKP